MQMNTFGPVGTLFLGNVHVFQGGVLWEIERQCRTMRGKKACGSAPPPLSPHLPHSHNVLKQIPSACVNATFAAAVLIPHNPQRT